MATFTKTSQNILGAINLGASIGSALGLGSRYTTPQEDQKPFNSTRQNVLAGIRRFGIQKTNLAYLTFDLPNILKAVPGITSSQILLLTTSRADVFSVPNINFATSEIKRYGIGPLEKKPYLPIFNDITVDFIADNNGDIHKFFYMWMNGIINFLDLPREGGRRDQFGLSQKDPFTIEFKDDYSIPLTIRTFSDFQKQLVEVVLEGAYPISIGEIQYNWNDESQLVRFPVTFTFTHWRYNIDAPEFQFATPSAEQSKLNGDIIYNLLIKAYPAAQALELAFRRPQQVQDVLNIVNAGRTSLSPLTRYF